MGKVKEQFLQMEGVIEELKEENEELEKENRLLSMTRDEFVKVFVDIGELVENTNLPRIGEQLVIEFKKLQEENERLKESVAYHTGRPLSEWGDESYPYSD